MIGILLNILGKGPKCFVVYCTNGYYWDMKACFQVNSKQAAAQAFDTNPEYVNCIRQNIKECTNCTC